MPSTTTTAIPRAYPGFAAALLFCFPLRARLVHGCCLRLAVRYLSDITLPSNIVATADAKAALERATHLVHAVPVQFTRDTLRKVRKHIPAGIPVLSVSKGIETKSGQLMCDLLQELLGESHSYAFLSGPSFAREIVEGKATAVVVASEDRDLACEFSDILSSRSFRVFTSRDVIGLEVGGAVKNVIAVAAGMSEGLGLGTNAMAALVTRGCIEMRRISLSFGGRPSTLAGLSGVGDTFGTCFGPLSRNRNLGIRIGRGERLKDILASSTEVAEGVDTAFSLEKLILNRNNSFRRDLKFPIIFGVCQVRIASSSRVRARGTAVTLALPPPLRRFFEGRSPPRKAWPQ